jgi:hypothetical protein
MYAVGLLLWAAVSLTLRLRTATEGAAAYREGAEARIAAAVASKQGLPRQVQMSQATHHLNKPQMPRWGVIPWWRCGAQAASQEDKA